ncbi:helix-turn-helix domain-containing protein, partial [Fictibacillus sp. KIGAM418]
MRKTEIVDLENVRNSNAIEVEDQNEVNFVFLEHVVIDSLIFEDIYEKMVYIVLKRFANFNSKQGFPSVKRLAQLSICSENKVRSSLKKLEAKKLIKVTMRNNGITNLSNKYTVLKITEELKELNYKNVEEKEKQSTGGVLHHVKGGTSPREGGYFTT